MKRTWLLFKRSAPIFLILCVIVFGMGQSGGGCATLMNDLSSNPGLYYGASRSAAAEGDFAKANAFKTLGDMYSWSGQQRHEVEVAREGRSQININNAPQPSRFSAPFSPPHVVQHANGKYQPEEGWKWAKPSDPNDFSVIPDGRFDNVQYLSPNYKSPVGMFMACNYWADLNNNGEPGFDELVNIKNRFSKSESLFLYCFIGFTYPPAQFAPLNCKNIKVIAFNPHGKRLTIWEDNNFQDKAVIHTMGDSNEDPLAAMSGVLANGGIGEGQFSVY